MIVDAIGALLSVFFWSSWGGLGGTRRETVGDSRRETVIRER